MGIYDSNWQDAEERHDEVAQELADKLYYAYNRLHDCKKTLQSEQIIKKWLKS